MSNYEGLKYENANLMAYSASGNKEAAYALANGAISEYADKIDQNIIAIQEVENNNADTAKQQLTKVYKYSLTVKLCYDCCQHGIFAVCGIFCTEDGNRTTF